MFRSLGAGLAAAALLVMSSGCSSDSADRRTIQLTQTDDGCTPATVALEAGEKVTFEVKNEASKDWEVEGIDGTRLEEVLIPSGRTRSVNYTAPGEAGTGKIKCYVPGGNSTIIELTISGEAETSDEDHDDGEDHTDAGPADDTVSVELASYTVGVSKPSVSAGAIKFVATNTSDTDMHELAVLRVKDDGSYENMGEIEDIDPLVTGEVVLDLPQGKYLLACLIAPGEAGSTVDHFQEGMKTEFTVE